MKLKSLVPVFSFALVMQAMTPPGFSEDLEVLADIPFAFIVGTKSLPPGPYKVIRRTEDEGLLQVTTPDNKHLATMLVLTRLAAQHQGDSPTASLVFDILQDKNYLSEIWWKDIDGYQVSTTTVEHKHRIVSQH